MIDTVFTLFENGYVYIKRHPQLLMTILLVIIIPISFLLSGQQFLTAARVNQDNLERQRIGLLHDALISIILVSNQDVTILQREFERIAALNPDISQLQLARRDDDNKLRILAAIDTTRIGTFIEDEAPYRTVFANPALSFQVLKIQNGTRFWDGYRLVETDSGEQLFIYSEHSLAYTDNLFADRVTNAYYWLVAILGIVLLLVLRHVRLIDYAYLYQETKKANEMKDLFTNMVAHELRAPLTAMRGYASMIRENTALPSSVIESASKIEESAGRLVLIVSDLLDVARIHSGKLSIQNSHTNIQKVIASVLDVMQAPAKEKNIQIARDGALGEIYAELDEKRLFQALTNLVSNSIKYTKAGTITIGIEDRSDRIEIRVKDTGMGIKAEDQKNLFAPFFRVENTEVNQTVGTGLGMWITKQMIELMKGSIAVESIRGVGTHIVVTLPK